MTRRRTALLSVSDKTGIELLGRALIDHDWQILSTGGTARALRDAGVAVVDVSDYTGFPEIMGGRVKTLHPAVHAGILARRGVDDKVLSEQTFGEIDLVVVNLYPFADTIARSDCTLDDAIEQIDVGGPAMLRAAAKNHAHVCVLCDPAEYDSVARQLPELPDIDDRRRLAVKAFAHTAAYDGQISQYLSSQASDSALPPILNLALERTQTLRYGENPHQAAGLYRDRSQPAAGLAAARPLQGKALSYNNLLDADAAWKGVRQLGDKPGCVIVKHTNPCGAAVADTLSDAYEKALTCDPTSAFGGIVALNGELDDHLARLLAERFLEVIVAPSISNGAREILGKKKNVRVICPEDRGISGLEIKAIDGGWLVQQTDPGMQMDLELDTVTERAPDPAELGDLRFAWAVVTLVRSNAIVYARQGATVGIGAGQMSRVDSARIGALKAADAGLSLDGAVMASDAFFPFADSIEAAAEQGIRAVIQPGGSMRDREVIDACNRHGIAMVLTGRRHFRH